MVTRILLTALILGFASSGCSESPAVSSDTGLVDGGGKDITADLQVDQARDLLPDAVNDGASWVPPAGAKPPFAGVWAIWGFQNHNTTDSPWLKGAMIATRWNKIERSNNTFDFSGFDADINKALSNGYEYLMFKIYVGSASPDWIYEPESQGGGGVPAVPTQPEGYYGQPYPYYLDTRYKALFKRMIDHVAEHVGSHSPEVRHRIVGIQCPIGRSGDAGGYFGEPIEPTYKISDAQWVSYSKEMFQYYYDRYQSTSPPIVPLFHSADLSLHEWLKRNTPRSWFKFANAGHCYQQHNFESAQTQGYSDDTRNYQSDGWAMLARDEADTFKNQPGLWAEAPVWFMYWTALHGLDFGLDFWNIQNIELVTGPEHLEGFEFFNKYAGYHDAAESPGAWIALRDGLDAKNVERFPEATFGTAHAWWTQTNANSAQRYLDIASAFSDYGAKQDPDYTPKFYTSSCSLPHHNDVGWGIVQRNFRMFISQLDVDETSQGYWRVGSTSQPYGRYARGFDHAAGKDVMAFDIDDRFFSDRPLAARYSVTIRVVYFNQGTGSWALTYDSVSDPQKTATTVTKTDSGQWQETVVTLKDAHFGNRGIKGSDLSLHSVDDQDDIFHMIEVSRNGST